MTKTISIKMVGSNKPIETRAIEPGTTGRDLLLSLGLAAAGFQLSDNKGAVFYGQADNIYAMVDDGALLMCSAMVDAGGVAWAA